MSYFNAVLTFVVGALSIIIALAWRDYLSDMFDRYVKSKLSWMSPALSGLIYVLIVTVIGLGVATVLSEHQEKAEASEEAKIQRTKERLNENSSRVNRVSSVVNSQIENPKPEDLENELPRKQRRINQIRSILGVDDKKVVSSALDDSKEDEQERKTLNKYEERLARMIIPKDVGMLHDRY